jgi:hypothetical protein
MRNAVKVIALLLLAGYAGAATSEYGNPVVPKAFSFGAPFIVDSTRYPSPMTDGLYSPRIAGADSIFLVVWEKDTGSIPYTDIYGVRMSAEGAILDSQPLPISVGTCRKLSPVAAFDGENFLVVWCDNRGPGTRLHLYGKFVTQAGVVLDSSEFRVCPLDSDQVEPDLCFGAGNYYCVWTDCRQYYGCPFGTRISPAGGVLDSVGTFLQLQLRDHSADAPAVASDDSAYLVAWHDSDYDNIYGTRVTAEGVPLDSVSIVFNDRSHYVYHPSLTYGGGNYFAVWNDDHGVNGARITSEGRNLDTLSIYLSSNHVLERPSAACGAGEYLALWANEYPRSGTIRASRVSLSGQVLDTSIPIDTAHGDYRRSPDVKGCAGGFVTVWSSGQWRYAIKGAMLDSLGQGEPFGIARRYQTNAQFTPSAASIGSNFLASWYDDRTVAGIYARRLDADGARPDSTAILIHPNDSVALIATAVAGATNYLVFWSESLQDRRRVWGRRLSSDGALLDSAPLALCTTYTHLGEPALGSDGSDYLLAIPHETYVWAFRVSSAGVLLDTAPIVVARARTVAGPAAVTFDGSNYWVAWQDYGGNVYLRLARVSRSGVLLDSVPVHVRTYGATASPLALACGERVLVVLWSEDIGQRLDVRGARVRFDRTLLDTLPITVSLDSTDETDVHAAFDSEKFLVVWKRQYVSPSGAGVRMDEDGVLSNQFPLNAPFDVVSLDLAANAQGEVLASFRAVPGGLFPRERVWAALGTWVGVAEPGRGAAGPVCLSIAPAIGHGQFLIHCPSQARVVIYDIAGKQVRVLTAAGGSVAWDGSDEQGRSVGAGVYTVCTQAGGLRQARRLVRL